MLQPATADLDSSNVINAKNRFAMKRYHDQYTWTPSSEVERAVVEAIFGKS
jgi:hypothetical protein